MNFECLLLNAKAGNEDAITAIYRCIAHCYSSMPLLMVYWMRICTRN